MRERADGACGLVGGMCRWGVSRSSCAGFLMKSVTVFRIHVLLILSTSPICYFSSCSHPLVMQLTIQ